MATRNAGKMILNSKLLGKISKQYNSEINSYGVILGTKAIRITKLKLLK